MKNETSKQHFIKTSNFKITIDQYLALSESKRVQMFLKTKIALNEMASSELKTSLIKKNLSKNHALKMSEGVIAYSEAMFDSIATAQSEKQDNLSEEELIEFTENEKESIDRFTSEVQEFDYFKKWRTIKTREAEDLEVVYEEYDLNEDHKMYKESLENNSYEERGIVYDFLAKVWEEAVLKAGISESAFEPDNGKPVSGDIIPVQTLRQTQKTKEDWNRINNERMSEYIEYMARASKQRV